MPTFYCLLFLQCSDLVLGLTPALVQWLRVNADPDTLCSGMGVCPAAALQAQVRRVLCLLNRLDRMQEFMCIKRNACAFASSNYVASRGSRGLLMRLRV